MNEKVTIGERVQKIRFDLDLSQTQFGEKLGKSHATISKIEANETQLNEAIINGLILHFNVNKDWLLKGEGNMFIASGRKTPSSKDSWGKELFTEFKKQINDEMRKKDEEISWLRAQMTTLIANVGKLTATSENAMSVNWNEDYKMTGSGNF